MPVSRRSALLTGAMAGVAALLPVGSLDAYDVGTGRRGHDPRPDVLERFSRSTFLLQLNTRFFVQRPGARAVATRLVEVGDLPTAEKLGLLNNEDCFFVRFRGPVGPPLPQDTYTFTHRALGSFRLFVVPSEKSSTGSSYVAMFNRLQPI